jgi:putative ABC transport system permease protein
MAVAIFAAASVAILAGMAVLAGAIAAARARGNMMPWCCVCWARALPSCCCWCWPNADLAGCWRRLAWPWHAGGAWAVVTQLFDFAWLPGWGTILAVLGGALRWLAMALGGSLGVLRTAPRRPCANSRAGAGPCRPPEESASEEDIDIVGVGSSP